MGSPKQLLPFRGRPLLRHAAETALETVCRPVIVVLGSQHELVASALEGLPVRCVVNTEWAGGMGTSIHAGVAAAAKEDVDGLILGLADQPMVSAEILNRLIEEHDKSGLPIVASSYADTVGVPVYFSRDYFQALLELKPDQGCKGLILRHREQSLVIACPQAEADVDTPAEYLRLTHPR